jgi:hypothetical protein
VHRAGADPAAPQGGELRFLRGEIERWEHVIKSAKITLD